MNKIVFIDVDKCIGCGLCTEICPNNLLYIHNVICKLSDEKMCDKSKGCEKVCPTGAIKIN